MTDDCFYYGCWKEAGHYMYRPTGRQVWEQVLPEDFPCTLHTFDGGFLPPRGPEIQGVATHCHLRDWTVISFWDRSVDSRGKSNSSFIIRGRLDFDAAVAVAREQFPGVWQRFKFEVVDAMNQKVGAT